ncbi:fumarylacetoacetate hydrolase family protein [Nocardioides sp.]|uniref:2-keto-4-pentenoate hydratase n=1 Tax=Nocardioides sp. TaxID=35761 RepID=UPI0026159237|nr:fumarylacetoacetate hydrolase family protein [Nocardioides sp.]
MSRLTDAAVALDEARRQGAAIPQLTSTAELPLSDAYAVQAAGIDLRVTRGEAVSGAKLGFTSKAKALQMGVDDVIIGVLTDAMEVADGGTVDLGHGVHPRVEPEVAFLLGSDVDPHAGPDAVAAAVTHVAAALEIIDSRYLDFRFSLADVVADNTSASHYVVGPWRPVGEVRDGLDLAALEVALSIDGTQVAAGSTADILGDPWLALPALGRMAAQYGQVLRAGAVLLAGAATAAVPLPHGSQVSASVAGLGTVGVSSAAVTGEQ